MGAMYRDWITVLSRSPPSSASRYWTRVRHGVYGLGSVINIVLRSDYEGTEVSAGAGLPTQKGRDSQHGSAL